MMDLLSFILVWWIYIFLIGVVAFPFLFFICKNSTGKGIFFSKIFGLLILTYITWILSRFKILVYSRFGIAIVLIVISIFSAYIILRNRKIFFSWIRNNFKIIIINEFIFFIFFIFFSIIRAYNSRIIGEEKFMDFAFLNSIGRATFFPPLDPWMSGMTINYYYLGYVMNSILIKLTGLNSAIGYNLGLASTLSLSFVCLFGLVYIFSGSYLAGLLSSVILVLSGNNDGFIQFVKLRGFQGFDFFKSSRIIPDTINEFPFFSFILGDLHPHYTSLPIFIFAIYICLTWWREVFLNPVKSFREMLPFIFITSLIIGFLLPANFWNFPTCFFIIIFSFLILKAFLKNDEQCGCINLNIVIYITIAVILSVILVFPFFIDFHSPQSIIIRLVSSEQRTSFQHFLICFAIYLFILISGLFLELRANFEHINSSRKYLLLYGFGTFLILLYCIFGNFTTSLIINLLLIIFLLIKYNITRKKYDNLWIWFLFFIGFFILLGCELFYLQDNYGHPYERMNTIFKFHYQVLVLFSIAIGGIVSFILEKKNLLIFWITFLLLFCFTLFYPFGASYARMDIASGPDLNGMRSYMKKEHPGDFNAISWLNNYKELPENPVILEASGDAYTYYGRVSTNTGIPSVLGWANHEFVWRGNWEGALKRKDDIKLLYETEDLDLARELIDKYKVTNIYWGELEKNTYSHKGIYKFNEIMKVIYEDKPGETFIFQVKK